MVRKIFILFVALISLNGIAKASDGKLIDRQQLPVKSQQILKEYFHRAAISYIKADEDLFNKEYDVVFTDGSKVEFDKEGNWKTISVKEMQVPGRLIPNPIKNHIHKNFPNNKIVEFEKDKKGYEAKLSNGLELKFDNNFRLKKVDD